MRLRFFIIIFSVLAVTAASISAIHYHFFKAERIRLIELNLQQNATLLANADLTLSKKEFSDLGQEFIDDLIGDDKVNMIVAIYNSKGGVLYKNDNAYIFDLPDSIGTHFSEWEDVEQKEYFIKYLTLLDKEQKRIIKVGMILNQSLLRWKDLNQRISIFGGILLVMITGLSFLLTFVLFRPVKVLAEQVNLMAEKVEAGEFVDLQYWLSLLKNKRTKGDEFQGLVSSLYKLANKVAEGQRMTQKWSALMAHELKTPMTILRMSIDRLVRESTPPAGLVEAVESELKKLEEIIMDFLEWASVENDTMKPDLHAINVAKRARELVSVIKESKTDVSFQVNIENTDLRVFCSPLHFDQLLNNLLTNASKYAKSNVQLELHGNSLIVQDDGEGIPERVLENFGRPFNKYAQKNQQGQGLGLAWVSTVARKYNWKIDFIVANGTRIVVTFPEV